MGNRQSVGVPLPEMMMLDDEESRKNEETITLIWYEECTAQHVYHKNGNVLKGVLRKINDYVLFFHENDQLLQYISFHEDEQIFITLVANSHSDSLLSKIHRFKQIHSIFLYVASGRDENAISLTTKYSKIVGCFLNQVELLALLQTKVQLFRKQSTIFNSYDDQKQTTTHDLTDESGSFLFSQLFKHVILMTKKTNESKRIMIAQCRSYYHDQPPFLESIALFEQTYQSSQAVFWYTKDTFIHRRVNQALRTEDIDALFTYQFFITDLSLDLMKHFTKLKKLEKSEKLLLYRGLSLPEDEIENLRTKVSKLISTRGYLSTTRSRNVAIMHADNALMEIEMDMNLQTVICADVADRSVITDEEEVLFDIGAVFEMVDCTEEPKDIDNGSNMDTILVFKMKATDKGSEIAKEYIEYQKTRIFQSDIHLMVGCLLIDMGEYKKASRYFQRILHQQPNNEKLACIYSNLAQINRLDRQYERSIYYYQQAYDLNAHIRPQRHISAARALNGIGIVHGEQHNYDSALENFILSKKLYRKYGKEDEEYAGVLNNIASAYRSLKNFEKSLEVFKSVREIQRRVLPSDHPDVAATLINIGNVYFEKKDYTTSLDYYMQSMKLKEKILPVEHQGKIHCLDNIGVVYYHMENYQQALEYFQKALMMATKTLSRNHVIFNELKDHIQLVNNSCSNIVPCVVPLSTSQTIL